MGAKKKSTRKMGAPSKYSIELADTICAQIASRSVSLGTIAADLSISPSAVYEWLFKHEDFAEKYARAREAQADLLAEEILEISDTAVIGEKRKVDAEGGVEIITGDMVDRSRLRVDARKWLASKLKPKKYGDALKLDGEVTLRHSLAEKLAAADARANQTKS